MNQDMFDKSTFNAFANAGFKVNHIAASQASQWSFKQQEGLKKFASKHNINADTLLYSDDASSILENYVKELKAENVGISAMDLRTLVASLIFGSL